MYRLLWCNAKETSSPSYCPPRPIWSSGERGAPRWPLRAFPLSYFQQRPVRLVAPGSPLSWLQVLPSSCLISSRCLICFSHGPITPPQSHVSITLLSLLIFYFPFLSLFLSLLVSLLSFPFFPHSTSLLGRRGGRDRNKELAGCLFSPWPGSPDPGLPSTVLLSLVRCSPWLCHTSSPVSTCSFHFQGLAPQSVLEFGNKSIIPFECFTLWLTLRVHY